MLQFYTLLIQRFKKKKFKQKYRLSLGVRMLTNNTRDDYNNFAFHPYWMYSCMISPSKLSEQFRTMNVWSN